MSNLTFYRIRNCYKTNFLYFVALFCLSISAWATQSVDKPHVDQIGLFANEATVTIATAQVAADPKLLTNSVNLYRVDDTGKAISVLSLMYDDGTHGDIRAGDGKFTTKITVNVNPGKLNLAASAAYKGQIARVKSAVLIVRVVRRLSDAENQDMFQALDTGGAYFWNRNSLVGDQQARIDTVTYLREQPGVADAGVSQDGITIWIHFNNGLWAGILTGPEDTAGGGGYGIQSTPNIALNTTTSPTVALSTSSVNYTGNARAIVLAPFNEYSFNGFGGYDPSQNIVVGLSNLWGASNVTYLPTQSVTVAVMKQLFYYGVISITTHGAIINNNVVLSTREPYTSVIPNNLALDFDLGLIQPVAVGFSIYWGITPAFIDTYAIYGQPHPNSLVYIAACNSLANTSMAGAFLNNGAKAYYGYDNIVHFGFLYTVGIDLFGTLADAQLDPTLRTTHEAYQKLGTTIDPTPPFANFKLATGSDPNLALPKGCEPPLIQWDVATGGNGHCYELVKTSLFWNQAESDAESRTSAGVHGYLASINSQAENTFLTSTFAPEAALGPMVFVWIGGYQPLGSPEPAGGWSWVSGEPWTYSNWTSIEPNNCLNTCRPENQLALVVQQAPGISIGQWGDADGVDPTDPNSHRAYYIVEYATP